jgi:Na+-transporting NADH:ubiquinone oxidoreductase subunit C
MNRDSNSYTFLFAAIMVFVVASSLAYTATSLKGKQDENVRKEQMQNILSTIGIQSDRDGAEKLYNEYITQQLALTLEGVSDDEVNAFKIQLGTEVKKPIEQQRFPLYVAEVKAETYYIVPLRGSGLWDAIWGYIALESDMRTIKGAVFDHKGETAGLGAEITQQWFQDRFVGEKITDTNGTLVGIAVSKTNNDPLGNDKEDHEVDAISGATITGDGVTDMISERLAHYTPYFKRSATKSVEEIIEETSTEEVPTEEAQTIAYQN